MLLFPATETIWRSPHFIEKISGEISGDDFSDKTCLFYMRMREETSSSTPPIHRNAEVTAMKRQNLLLALMFIAVLALAASGCYTQLASRTTEGGAVIRSERTAPSSDDRDAAAEADDNEVYVEDDNAEEDDGDVQPEFGLKARKYADGWYSETEYDDGKTVINNFYYGGYRYYPDYWYRTRPGWWYDSYRWDYRPGMYVGFGIGYDPYWRFGWYGGWSWGYDGWWVDPYPGWWDDPWYYHAWWPHRYGGWYAYDWYDHHDHYGGYHPGGNGGGDGDRPDSGRKYRQDRYAGFGTSRDAGGVVTVGGGSSNGGETTEKASTSRATRRDGRSGFGTTGSTRRETGVETGTTEKKADTATTRRTGTTRRYQGDDGATVRQRTDSGFIIRRRSTSDESADGSADKISREVQENGDREYRMNDRSWSERTATRIESPEASGNTDTEVRRAVRTRSVPWTIIRRSTEKTAAETEASSGETSNSGSRSDNGAVERTTRRTTQNAEKSSQESTSSERSVERSSSRTSSQPSYSSPSSGARSSSASSGSRSSGGSSGRSSGGGGGSSRSSGGSGSRRR